MKLKINYEWTDLDRGYNRVFREYTIPDHAEVAAQKKEMLAAIYEGIGTSTRWHCDAYKQGKHVFELWGYGHSWDGIRSVND